MLLELQRAKYDGRIKGQQILDEPAYLRPIVAKLPADLLGRKHAFKYKTQQVVDYPPFAEFWRFIQEVAKERNDPYLKLERCDESESFHGISTAKTAVTNPESPEKIKSVESPDKWYFLHERPHPLRICRELRSRPYSERLGLTRTASHLFSLRFIIQSHCERLNLRPKLRNMSQRQTRDC